jgi:tRNA threonylcarbamoyladenosine modification (KEOPS) complex  Pcc1 subunit
VPLPTDEDAEILRKAIAADRELKLNEVSRTVECSGNTLLVRLSAIGIRQLRTSSSVVMASIRLSAQTIARFGNQ